MSNAESETPGANHSIGGAAEQNSAMTYYLRRRDGERPLGITAAVVALLTFFMALAGGIQAHDWRPVGFYTAFCLLSLLAAVLLGLQWRNDRLIFSPHGFLHYDWRGRSTSYHWAEIQNATERRRSYDLRLTLRMASRDFVLHGDVPEYAGIVNLCRVNLAARGQTLELDAG